MVTSSYLAILTGVRLTAGGSQDSHQPSSSGHMICHVLPYDCEAWWDPGHLPDVVRGQPKGRYESIGLVVFLCILLVVTIVNIMDFSGYLITLSHDL